MPVTDETIDFDETDTTVKTQSGDDVLIFNLSEAISGTNYDFQGGSGIDTVALQLTEAQWLDPAIRDVLSEYLIHLETVSTNPHGEVSNGSASDFVFDFGDGTILVVQMMETLAVSVCYEPGGEYEPIPDLREAFFAGDMTGSVTEDAAPDTVSGDLDVFDLDATDDLFQAVATGTLSDNGYGTYSISNSGVWAFTLDNSNPVVDDLDDGEVLTDTFTVFSEDGSEQVVTITINGADDYVLPSTFGVLISGINVGDFTGTGLGAAGDFNGDGIDDFLVGAYNGDPNGANSGEANVIFGGTSLPGQINLADLNGSNGFTVNGATDFDRAGRSVSSAGDVNGDGIEDILIGAETADPNGAQTGAAYVVFGSTASFSADFNVNNLDGSNGFAMVGINSNDFTGYGVSGAGDVNGDGFDDVLIGAYGGDPNGSLSGESYVVFGSSAPFSANIDLAALDGTDGFRLNGVDAVDISGRSVSGAGDVNGDGIDDFLIGAYNANPNGNGSGETYVVFGSGTGFGATFDLASLDGSNGYVLNGINSVDRSGGSVASAGDVNGDGIDDILIGAFAGDAGGTNSGEAYVVFGTSAAMPAQVELSSLDGTNGFRLDGDQSFEYAGSSVSSAGDVNGDGFDDVLIGAYGATPSGASSGESYLVYGTDQGFAPSLDLGALNGADGFVFNGISANDFSGLAVSAAGDVNDDGFADLLIGAYGADNRTGEAYLVYGGDGVLEAFDNSDGTVDGTIELSNLMLAPEDFLV